MYLFLIAFAQKLMIFTISNEDKIHYFHLFTLVFEYTFIPSILFYFIYKTVHKQESEPMYIDISPFVEALARNWKELMFTFIFAWIAFEIRLISEAIIEHEKLEIELTMYNYISLSTFVIYGAFFFAYFYLFTRSSKEESEEKRAIKQVRKSIVPITLYSQLFFLPFIYESLTARVIVASSILFFAILIFHNLGRNSEYYNAIAINFAAKGDTESFLKAIKNYIYAARCCYVEEPKRAVSYYILAHQVAEKINTNYDVKFSSEVKSEIKSLRLDINGFGQKLLEMDRQDLVQQLAVANDSLKDMLDEHTPEWKDSFYSKLLNYFRFSKEK